jgi:hypothetical protein
MYSVRDMNSIFVSTSDLTDSQLDYHAHAENNALNQTIIKNYEEEGSIISEPMSLRSSPINADVQTKNGVKNSEETSERRDNCLCSIYEIRILYFS